MERTVKAFNKEGLKKFRIFIDNLSVQGFLSPPFELLDESTLTDSVNGFAEIDDAKHFPDRLSVGKYLNNVLNDLHAEESNCGMWAWLSLVYFEQLCPPIRNGKINPGKVYGYIPSELYTEYYRHKLLGPYTLYKLHGEYASTLLSNPPHKVGEINEQIASRQTIVSNKEMIKAIHKLYYDADRTTFKRGATTRNKAGTVDRFWRVKEQLDFTYDFFSMQADSIIELLPSEFDRWRM
ncbi:hypothetical protein CR161_00830 [Prosthecochloris sp. ZM]|uniref:hypothetical protein n=1 Tax=Prosthecochloris sp. ZM TaxID=2283143 RepID=UPI000DF7AA21|nr:hypothetical protein [Prosthecochloris sp. ZM]RDD29366.1 hypothetical protein CR161_00830 [Prosthecochloris sp. ZM]